MPSTETQNIAPDQVPQDALTDFVEPLLALVGTLTGMESNYLTRIDLQREIQEVLVARNDGDLELNAGLVVPWEDTLCRRVLASDKPGSSNVAQTWPDAEAAIGFGISSLVSLPVKLSDGQLWGTLCSASATSMEADETALSIMRACARLIAQQIELFQRAHLAEQSLGRMALVAEAGQICLNATSLDSAVGAVGELLKALSLWQQVLPFTLEGDRVRIHGRSDGNSAALIEALIDTLGDTTLRRHDHQHSPLLAEDKVNKQVQALRRQLGLGPGGPIGLLTAATPNQLQAGIVVLADDSTRLEARDEQMLISCSNALSLLADRLFHHGSLQARNLALSEEAGQDVLTGLPNRRQLLERLTQLIHNLDRNEQQLLVAFIDLDGFKRINDQHGHEAGDLFLVSIAQRLTNSLRSDDWVARLGGDEFVVLTVTGSGRVTGDIVRHLSERIDQAIVGSHDIGTMRIDYSGASIGVVGWAGESANELLRRADEAMYAAKARRRGHG